MPPSEATEAFDRVTDSVDGLFTKENELRQTLFLGTQTADAVIAKYESWQAKMALIDGHDSTVSKAEVMRLMVSPRSQLGAVRAEMPHSQGSQLDIQIRSFARAQEEPASRALLGK